ncbi:ABC transporter family substrate-binding protein [Leucobacter albus]|uniref:ABC transporter family substrate-binding protein n=1 Tax=Leucobacter albus TaxID=272210 RepID=A0ABW3TL12_9MICO
MALFASATIALSSCASTAAPQAETPALTASTNDINPTDRGDLEDGGVLQWALSASVTNFNYYNLNGAQVDTFNIMGALLPRPFHYSPAGEPTVNEDFYSSIEVLSQDPLTVAYEIQPDAVWSDGSAIGAADFAGMWRANSGNDERFEGWGTTGYDRISDVTEGETPQQVVVTFGTYFADWQSLFDPLIPASLTATPEAFNTSWAQAPLVTAGPFVWGGEDKSAKTYSLKRNPDWWGEPAVLDEILFRVYGDPSAFVGSFKTGQLDFWEADEVEQYQAAKELGDASVRSAGSPVFRMFTFNKADEVLSDQRVRQAIILGTDRVRMAGLLAGKIGGEARALQNHIFMPNQMGYAENCGELCEYDPEAAKALLEEAGWSLGGDGYFEKDGKPLDISMVVQSGRANSAHEAQIAQSSLKEAGIKLTIRTVPVDDFFSKYVTVGNFQLATWTWNGVVTPVAKSLSMYTLDPNNIQRNYGAGGTTEINDLLQQAVQSHTLEEKYDTANLADEKIWEDAAWLPLYQVPQNTAARANVANLGSQGFADIRFQEIGFAKQ